MDLAALTDRIEVHERAYLEEVRLQIGRYPALASLIPDFLKGCRRVEAHIAVDGAIILHYRSEFDSFVVEYHRQSSTSELARELTNGLLDLGNGAVPEVSLAGVELRRVRKGGSGSSEQVVWRSPTEMIHVCSLRGWWNRTPQLARNRAEADVQTFINAHRLGLENLQPSIARSSVIARLSELVDEFARLLDQDPTEEDLQRYLEQNRILLGPTAKRILPKHRFGAEYISDFVVEKDEGEYLLVELEHPGHRLFTKTSDPTRELRHGISQVETWQQWIAENLSYARSNLPGVSSPDGLVVIGRRRDLTVPARKALRRTNAALQGISVVTYDRLLGDARRHLDMLKSV